MLTRLPFSIAILTILNGVIISILFGINEDYFKGRIRDGLEKNTKLVSIQDAEKKSDFIKAETDKNWRYYQRFHFHSTGIGAISLGIVVFLYFLSSPRKLKLITAWLVSLGGLGYPFLWLFAGIYGPEMGRNEAKEAFAIFGYMGGLFLIGLVITLFLSFRYSLLQRKPDNS